MASKSRSSGGCWTCRLRRKKCDEERPVCQGCHALEIDCLYSDDKPEWMDGGERQKQKAEWLKQEVKRRATHRRERRYLQGLDGLEVRLETLDASLTDDSDTSASKDVIHAATMPMPSSTSCCTTPPSGAQDFTPDSASGFSAVISDSSVSAPSPAEPSGETAFAAGTHQKPAMTEDIESHLMMMYLDYVFPFLFPYYRPSFADVGRGWLLVLLTKNKALFHSALSLAGYFYGIILDHIGDAPPQCHTHNLEALQEQQGLALSWLQLEMQDIVTRGVKGNLVEANRVMASIIQLLTCDVAIANPGNWPMHLDAATELFIEIMKHHSVTPKGHSCFMMVLLQLGSQPFSWTPKNHPWGSSQATLRFFTAQLLFFDTLASTSLQRPPRLHAYHELLLATFEEGDWPDLPAGEKELTMPHINLQEFFGAENWVICAIGEIAALDAWKKEMKRAGSLSVSQLMCRATTIQQSLRTSLQKLEQAQGSATGPSFSEGPQHFLQYYAGRFTPQMMHGSAANTRIWAQAAITYLGVVLSGWQPSCAEIRNSVAQTIEMLLALPNPDCLRTLVWPFTVTGCLAAPDQEHIFREVVAAMGPLKVIGTIREGLAVMEKVWERRAEIDGNPDQWDLAACLNGLGQPALLI